jgi:site-specific DNA recombinase
VNKPVLRCAVYTRVSNDSGLEQDFNSLDAQRESAEAYIKSQAHEGWKLVRDRFDDGGLSGGSMDRPALQRLLAKIREQRIDVVVVYKVDRLTRSLADFAKLVDIFDAHKVSFVSVTQSFNTTSSMGRLTLNVLLSFAQFEREVTAERIRDKVAASKKKGIWMGGVVPYGYRVENRKLLIVEDEAEIIRLIFDLYLAHGSVRTVQHELRQRGLFSRERTSSSGRKSGGIPFTNGPISHILRNRHYIGEINHKDQSYKGEHEAVLDRDLFERVQTRLGSQRCERMTDRAKSHALLLGKLFNGAGELMSPTYAVKQGVRYRYYISVSAMQSRPRSDSHVHRVRAEIVESAVVAALQKPGRTGDPKEGESTQNQEIGGGNLQPTSDSRGSEPDAVAREFVEKQLVRAVIRADKIQITRREDRDTDETTILTVPWTPASSARRKEILEPEISNGASKSLGPDERARLLRAMVLARGWMHELIEGSIPDAAAIAIREGRSERSIRMTLSLAFLDPALVKAAVDSCLPQGYGVTKLADLPPRFEDQWSALGLQKPF